MYSLMIVDDETEIREGLLTFDFQALSIGRVKACENGLSALEILENESFDLIISDIRMPYMDGLALAQQIARKYPDSKVIILSGYSDFEYARKCISYGVVTYLLKPIDFMELQEALAKTVQLLKSEKEKALRQSAIERKLLLSTAVHRKKFLQSITTRPLGDEEMEEGSVLAEVRLDSDQYTVVLLRMNTYPKRPANCSGNDWRLAIFALDNILKEFWVEQDYGYHDVDAETGECLLLVTDSSLQTIESGLTACMAALLSELVRFRGLFRTSLTYAIGSSVQDLRLLPLSRHSAACQLGEKGVGQTNPPAVHSGIEGPAWDETEAGAEMRPADETTRKQIQEAKAYILANFNRSLSLQDVADHVYMNPSYFSYLFKGISGQNYIDFLTDCRVQEAQKLLADVQWKIYQVGEMVGYENPRYFSYIFKKYTGKTPVEFRNQTT
jgi:two-component system response regulator YesN